MSIESILNNRWIVSTLYLLVFLYGSYSRIMLPPNIVKLFNNPIFKFVFLSLILIVNFNKLPHVAVIIALTFLITMYYVHRQERFEKFISIKYKKINKLLSISDC